MPFAEPSRKNDSKGVCPYDSSKEPDPKYLREILKNRLNPEQISNFCEDFVRLLFATRRGTKIKYPAWSEMKIVAKQFVFPILGLVHHGNMATVPKQRTFNRSMITPFTALIFIDEAADFTLDIDDWKTLTNVTRRTTSSIRVPSH